MATITSAAVVGQNGNAVPADCFGNNAAILCPGCKSVPLLLIARPNQRGSNKEHNVTSKCGMKVWMSSAVDDGIMVYHATIANC